MNLAGEEKLVMNAVPIVTAPIKKSMLACSQMSATVKSILLTQKAYVPPPWHQQVNLYYSKQSLFVIGVGGSGEFLVVVSNSL